MMRRFLLPVFVSACVLFCPFRPALAGISTYLSLGDSLAFGVGGKDSLTDISNGDRGYVSKFADILAARSGGVRPDVVNLGISGETSSSFFGNGFGLGGPLAVTRNTNYTGNPLPNQDALMLSTIQSQLAAGNTISTVTLSLGANDLFLAFANNTPFDQVFATFQTNELTLLTQIRTLLPGANLILLGYYDPYSPFANDSSSPYYAIAQASAQAIPAINQYIAADAAAFNGLFVDLQPLFHGHDLDYTYIATGNVHPNDLGYQVIANAFGSVPEPSTVILLGMGLLPIAYRLRKTA